MAEQRNYNFPSSGSLEDGVVSVQNRRSLFLVQDMIKVEPPKQGIDSNDYLSRSSISSEDDVFVGPEEQSRDQKQING